MLDTDDCEKKGSKYICSNPKRGVTCEDAGFYSKAEYDDKLRVIVKGIKNEEEKTKAAVQIAERVKIKEDYKRELLRLLERPSSHGSPTEFKETKAHIIALIGELKGGKRKSKKQKNKKRKTRRRVR